MTKTHFSMAAFILALGFWFYQFTRQDFDQFGLQFRYLTIWGLCAAVAVHWLLWRVRRSGAPDGPAALISASAVLNIMVMFLYWRLFFIDPKLVNGDGTPVWYQEYYLHLLGPLLLVFDALFLSRAFARQVLRGLIYTVAFCAAYVVWCEAVLRPINTAPVGKVTSGLPYPFLNDMELAGRAGFYGTTIATALVFYGLCWAVSWVHRRLSA